MHGHLNVKLDNIMFKNKAIYHMCKTIVIAVLRSLLCYIGGRTAE